MKGKKLVWLWACLMLFVGGALADTLKLKENFPEVYVVKKGDTLWDISALYLHSPWLWPRLWQFNPQVENPHLIYPGDRLSLIYENGEPRLVRKRIVKVSPKVHVEEKASPIPTVPLAAISAFLSHDHIVDEDALKNAPYVLGDNDAQSRIAIGRAMYVRGQSKPGKYYGVYRVADKYRDPETKEELGQTLTFIAVAVSERLHENNITQFKVTQVLNEINQGDILLELPDQDRLPAYFVPNNKQLDSSGYIVSAATDTSVMSRYDVVIINKGTRDQVAPGDMFAIAQPGTVMIDKVKRKSYEEMANHFDRAFNNEEQLVTLPNEKVGELMVFKAYEKLSYAIITDSKVILRENYLVENL
ncbi:LysM peptidoglycan-binding domain-containing protein [Agarivorans sp. MS3-6]|uniref:LysM peptidoglycan-binding domain-containing protein n=1 Tax=Agarivorans sp. TSD2052 TaxID=2937286 RepID=UPI00200C0AD0|nr:LysM domain-containing protein [Agarivorans sp. TSD2052]UPW18909.1 LysM peptidoglycan-binding domain-containing protein [Agarivorans sp. TSD2052]